MTLLARETHWTIVLRLWFPGELRSYADGMFSAGIALGIKNEARAKNKLRLALALGAKARTREYPLRAFASPDDGRALRLRAQPRHRTGLREGIIHAQHLGGALAPDAQELALARADPCARGVLTGIEAVGFLLGQGTEETARAAQGAAWLRGNRYGYPVARRAALAGRRRRRRP